jgi:ribosomal protein L18
MYDEISKKLEAQRLEREAAYAKKERDRERALAKHERLLVNRSMSKLLSAAVKAAYPGEAAISAFSDGSQGERSYISAVDRDLQEAAQYGIAAAEVAIRRKNEEAKAQIEESAEKHQAARRKKTKCVNIMV